MLKLVPNPDKLVNGNYKNRKYLCNFSKGPDDKSKNVKQSFKVTTKTDKKYAKKR